MIKYIIGAILGFMLGGGIEFERGSHEIHAAYEQVGLAYGCGALAATRDAVRKFNPDAVFLDERPWCANYRKMWESE